APLCLEPTQVRITVTTDVCELADVKILKNGAKVTSTKPAQPCDRIGTLVFVPSGATNRFVVEVQGSLPNGSCEPNSKTCVRALRTVSFQTHAAFELPIALSRSCVGVICEPGTTCDMGQCVPVPVVCERPPCDQGDASMPDVIVADAPGDGRMEASFDAGVLDVDADAGPVCGGQFK